MFESMEFSNRRKFLHVIKQIQKGLQSRERERAGQIKTQKLRQI